MPTEDSAKGTGESLHKAGEALKEAADSLAAGDGARSAEALHEAGEFLEQASYETADAVAGLAGEDDTPPYGTPTKGDGD